MKRLIAIALFALPLCAQTALRSTTLSAAVTASDRVIYVASATGIEVGDVAFVDKEAMKVRAISGTMLTVLRGHEGVAGAHASGSLIYVDDPTYFTTRDRSGPCVAASELVLPLVNITNGKVFQCLSSVWREQPGEDGLLRYTEVTISAADIVATGAGKFGHAAGYPLLADPGAGKVAEFVSAVLIYDHSTADYANGGNVTININGGAAVTGLVSAANSMAANADKIVHFAPLAAAGNAMTANKGFNLVSSAAFTNPGTAAGTIKVKLLYRVHTTGL
jgi:hypothetical protein